MPSRRENKRRLEARKLRCETIQAASVVQEMWRWRRRKALDWDHLAAQHDMWQLVRMSKSTSSPEIRNEQTGTTTLKKGGCGYQFSGVHDYDGMLVVFCFDDLGYGWVCDGSWIRNRGLTRYTVTPQVADLPSCVLQKLTMHELTLYLKTSDHASHIVLTAAKDAVLHFRKSVHWGINHEYEAPSRVDTWRRLEAELNCRICHNLIQNPVFAACCDSASTFGAACYGCAYSVLQMHKPPKSRSPQVRSWSLTCHGCQWHPPASRQTISTSGTVSTLTNHTVNAFYDRMRDEVGPSKCFQCYEVFDTTAALRRHLRTNCTHCSCNVCDFYGSRGDVREHFAQEHERVRCPCCNDLVLLKNWKQHVKTHQEQLERTQISQTKAFEVNPDGVLTVRRSASSARQ